MRLAIVDRDRSTMSVQLIDRISQSGYFVFSSYEDSYESAAEVLSRGRADIILEIPSGMEKAVGRGETAEIYIAANAVNNTKGAMGGGYLSSIVTDFSSELSVTGSAPLMKIVPQYRYNLFFVLIFMLMSGIFTPVSSMETWSQYVTYFLPTRYFVNILRAVCLKGSHFADMTFDFVMLSVFAVAINIVAVVTYRKQN